MDIFNLFKPKTYTGSIYRTDWNGIEKVGNYLGEFENLTLAEIKRLPYLKKGVRHFIKSKNKVIDFISS